MAQQIQLRHGTAAQWTAANPVLAQGEAGCETDSNNLKLGDGTSHWAQLPYLVSPAGPAARNYLQEASQGIDPLLVGLVPGPASQAALNADGTRNAGAWFAPYTRYLTCVSTANSLGGWSVTAVTPQAVVSEAHVGNLAGAVVTFTPADGTADITRTLGAQLAVAGDLVAYSLNAPLPSNIVPAQILPVALPAGYTFQGSPVLFERQDGLYYVGEVSGSLRGSVVNGVAMDYLASAAAPARVPWTFSNTVHPNPSNYVAGPAITGDSTRPVFLVLGGRPVLLFCFFGGNQAVANGPDVGASSAALQAAIGNAYPLTFADLTAPALATGPQGSPVNVFDTPAARNAAIAALSSAAPFQPLSACLSALAALTNSFPVNNQVTLAFSGLGISKINDAGFQVIQNWINGVYVFFENYNNQYGNALGIDLEFSNNQLDQPSVDGLLSTVASAVSIGPPFSVAVSVDLHGGPNAVPTGGAGNPDISTIQNTGGSVTTN